MPPVTPGTVHCRPRRQLLVQAAKQVTWLHDRRQATAGNGTNVAPFGDRQCRGPIEPLDPILPPLGPGGRMRGDELLPRQIAALITGNQTLTDETGRPVDLAP